MKKPFITLDSEQARVWQSLEHLATLINTRKKLKNIKGIYLWGPVGRGKTMLIDNFYYSLNTKYKTRMHFQNFMKYIHEELTRLNGRKNCMRELATILAESFNVICLDDFYIDDIANATIISNLMKELYQKQIIFVITSNSAPDYLNANVVIRERSQIATQLLNQHNDILSIDAHKDYRLLFESHNIVFFWDEDEADNNLLQFYKTKSGDNDPKPGEIIITNRRFYYKGKSETMIWFDFKELCEKPRSHLDYINLAKQFDVFLISDIPQLDNGLEKNDLALKTFYNNRTKRFINLIDELYDKSMLLVASFKCPLHSLYLGDELQAQFTRTYSRLTEMQSLEYLKKSRKE